MSSTDDDAAREPATDPATAPTPQPGAEVLVEELLVHAATAHGVYEHDELGGVHDADWPAWYARHIAAELRRRGLTLTSRQEGSDASS